MTEFSEQVEAYVLQDRQWNRQCRIGYAKMMLARMKTEPSRNFWRAVLQRSDHDERDKYSRTKS